MDNAIRITPLTAFLGFGFLTLVDAANGEATLDAQPEAVKQAALADRLVLTKSDLASPTQTKALRERPRHLSPGALLVPATADLEALGQPPRWSGIGTFLEMLVSTRAASLLRAKELLNLAGQDRPFVIHAVQHVFHEPVRLPEWPQEMTGARVSCSSRATWTGA